MSARLAIRVRRRAFTLTEMIVVLAIVLVLIAVALPSVTRMWEERKLADAENTLRGSLTLARRLAMSPEHGETGVLFALDGEGNQKAYLIEQMPLKQQLTSDPSAIPSSVLSQRRWVVTDRSFTLPAPFRVAPRYAVEEEPNQSGQRYMGFSAEELADDGFPQPAISEWQEPQRHRNYFSLVFSEDGHLQLRADVLIHDPDTESMQSEGTGDRTGMPVAAQVDRYHPADGARGSEAEAIDPSGNDEALEWLVVSNGAAVNFVSADGLLLYDDSLFQQMGTPEQKRAFMLEGSIPVFVAGPAGHVIRGPVDEGREPQ